MRIAADRGASDEIGNGGIVDLWLAALVGSALALSFICCAAIPTIAFWVRVIGREMIHIRAAVDAGKCSVIVRVDRDTEVIDGRNR